MLWAPSPGVAIPRLNHHQDETQASGVVTSPAQETPGTTGQDKEGSPEEGPSQISLQRGSHHQGINKTGGRGWRRAKRGPSQERAQLAPPPAAGDLGPLFRARGGKGPVPMDTGAQVLPSAGMSLCTPARHSQPGQGLCRPLLQMETLRLQEAALLTLWSLPRVRTVRTKVAGALPILAWEPAHGLQNSRGRSIIQRGQQSRHPVGHWAWPLGYRAQFRGAGSGGPGCF